MELHARNSWSWSETRIWFVRFTAFEEKLHVLNLSHTYTNYISRKGDNFAQFKHNEAKFYSIPIQHRFIPDNKELAATTIQSRSIER